MANNNSSNAVAIVAILVILLLVGVVLYFVFAGDMMNKGSTVNVLPAAPKVETPATTTSP